jgi:hypothetical protein
MSGYRDLLSPEGRAEIMAAALDAVFLRRVMLGLTILLLLQLLWGGGRVLLVSGPDAVPPVPESMQPRFLAAPAPVDVEENELVNRPLYWQGRSRKEAQSESEEKSSADDVAGANDPIQKVELLGVFTGGDAPGVIAKVRGRQQRVLVGERILGWELSMLSIDGAVFEKGGRNHELRLEHVYPRNVTRPGVARPAAERQAAERAAAAAEEAHQEDGADNEP